MPQDQRHCFLRFSSGADDEAFIVLQDAQPILDVGCTVAEAVGCFQANMTHQGSSANLGHKFFLAVFIAAEVGCTRKTVEALFVAGAVGQFMKEGAVILRCADELLTDRENNFVGRWTVESSVAFLVGKLHAFAAQVVVYDILRGFQRFSSVREGGFDGVLGGDTFALIDVKYVVLPQVGHFLDFTGLFILLLDPLPEDYHARFLTLAHTPTSLSALLESDVFPRTLQQHLIQQGIRLVGGVEMALPQEIQGFSQGMIPCSSCFMMRSVTAASMSILRSFHLVRSRDMW